MDIEEVRGEVFKKCGLKKEFRKLLLFLCGKKVYLLEVSGMSKIGKLDGRKGEFYCYCRVFLLEN